MTAVLAVALVAACVVAAGALLAMRRARAEIERARVALVLDAHAEVGPAVAQLKQDADDRVADAEALQHWLIGALDQSSDGIVVVDRIGREILRNAAARTFHGARHGDVLAEDAMQELFERALLGQVGERELQLYGPPRQVLHLRSFPLYASGEIVGAVTFSRDVSEARRVESVRRDFVANVSHELKTPIGALGLLAETMAASDDPVVMQRLGERVSREADRLARIVDDLLDLSLIEAQEHTIREPVPASALVGEAVDRMRAVAETAGVPLQVEPEPPEVLVSCDHRQLRSALVNLLENAIKYSEPGQTVEIGAWKDDAAVAFVVRDHGIGIPTRDLERIFERFYRVDRARSRDTGGTGLGLAIVRHVAQAHGGDVVVESREGEGSAFTLSIPIAKAS
ncbi:MAG TPA: ATP-binding protein [Acidimicrobiia bacterium]|nr:ATP-binding protein [Acidimicrobiia bacterium]